MSVTGVAKVPWRRFAQWAVITLVVGFWVWFMARNITELMAYPWQVNLVALVLAGGVAALYFLCLALGWTLMIRRMGEPMPFGAGVRIWFLSTFMRYVPGNLWHVVGRIVMGGELGVSRTKIFVSTAVEQVLQVLSALVVFAFLLPFWPQTANLVDSVGLPVEAWWLMAALVPLGLVALYPPILEWGLNLALRLVRRPPLELGLRYADILLLLGWHVLTTIVNGLSACLVVGGLTLLPLEHWPMIAGIAAGAWAIGYLSLLTPTGLGVREGAMTALLVLVMPLPVATVASLLARIVSSLGEVTCVAAAKIVPSRTS